MFDDKPNSIVERGAATPEMMAAAAMAAAGTIALGDFAQRRQAKQSMWDGLKQDLASTATGAANIAMQALNSLEIPMQGLHGMAATTGVLLEGGSLQDALMRGGTVARQPLEQTGKDLGKYVADQTGSAPAAALTDAITNVASPF